MKNKKELEEFRKTVRAESIKNGLGKLTTSQSAQRGLYLLSQILESQFTGECISHLISNYLEKVVVVSHTEKGRKICDKVRITLDPEVINKYLNQSDCISLSFISYRDFMLELDWDDEVNDVLVKKTEKINIGLIIEIKIPDLEVFKREQLENEQENQFFGIIERNRDKYKLVDRRHLIKVLEEQ